jgi:transcriptional regulator with XRE-family HTH domain
VRERFIVSATTNRARRAREGAGLSIGQAAKLLGVDRDVLFNVEELDSAFWSTPATFRRNMADVYGVSEAWLGGQGDLRDYAALDRIAGGRELPFHDRDVLAEVLASRPRRPV